MIVSIHHKDGTDIEQRLDGEAAIIGRSSSCDISVDSDNISRKHLEIKKAQGKILIKDVSSSNWVSYDGEQLSKDEYVQYFDFMDLYLPGGLKVTISTSDEAEVRDKTSITEIKTISKTRTISRTDIIESPKKEIKTRKASKRNIKVSNDEPGGSKNSDSRKDTLVKVILFVSILAVGGLFIYFDLI